jgi:hypothetical protein
MKSMWNKAKHYEVNVYIYEDRLMFSIVSNNSWQISMGANKISKSWNMMRSRFDWYGYLS